MNQPVYSRGTIVGGKYRINKAIARGGCSIVYRGTHIEMNRSVALKIMTTDGGALDQGWTKRFQREARLASQLRHPNTIVIYDYGRDQGLWYIAMEWVDGPSLRNEIKEHSALEPHRVARLSVQMLQSLSEAHQQRILHRDLKPSNIMLSTDHEGREIAKVLDFGLAKADPKEWETSEGLKLTRDGDFVGTPRYAAPEQLKGEQLGRASDIYGIGMVMWEMLTGAPAVPEIDYATCVEYHLGPNPWRLPPGMLPPDLAMIVEKALAKEASARFQSCEEMIIPLLMWLKGAQSRKGERFDDPGRSEDDGFFETIYSGKNGGREPARSEERTEPLGVRQTNGAQTQGRRGMPEREEVILVPLVEDIEIDRPAAKRVVRPSTRPRPHREKKRDQGKRVWVGAVSCLSLLGIVGITVWSIRGENQEVGSALVPATAFVDRSSEENAHRHDLARAQTRNPEDIIILLRREGWSFVQQPESLLLGSVKQTTMRVKKEREHVDVTFYETTDLSLARELESGTESPAEAVRLGLTTVRIRPVGGGGVGMAELRQRLSQIRAASINER